MIRKTIITILIVLLYVTAYPQKTELSWPEISRMSRPWTRWWWPDSIVTPGELTLAMQRYSEAGLGGIEITVIYGVKGYEERFIEYLSPQWINMFTHTLMEAEKLDLGVDLANAPGWPFGGPWVDQSDASRNINYKIYSLTGGERLNETIEFIQQPLLRVAGQKPDPAKLTEPVSSNRNLQLYAIDQIRLSKSLPLYSLIAFSDSGRILDLLDLVTPHKLLDWTAPEDNWTLYALFE